MNKNVAISYADLIKSFQNFKKVDHEGFNRFDSPANLYFKIVFYFNEDNGLLGLNQMAFDDNSTQFENEVAALKSAFSKEDGTEVGNSVKNFDKIKNTAYHYLLLNDELERARMLKKFVILLSEINANSPWYFTEITGLDAALERTMFTGEMKIEEQRKSISIKCLPDSYDNRIGTLLDLYRAICYSYQMKREVLPANLRKFNMGILLFNQPIRGLGGKSGDRNARITIPDMDVNIYIPSCKLIELRNCEIDQNSAKSAFGTLKADEPLAPEYTINIFFDDAYESRYNEIMQYVITDFINADIHDRDEEQWLEEKGNTPEGVRPLKLKYGGPDYKGYWVNTDMEKNTPYDFPMTENPDAQAVRDINDVGAKGPFTTLVTNAVDKVTDAIKIPEISLKNNIHDAGTVSQYGTYEYLNRMSNSDSLLGQAMSTGIGQASRFMKQKVTGMFLGNIYGSSIAQYLDYAKKLAAGDVIGFAQDIKNEQKKKSDSSATKDAEQLKGKKLPQYKQVQQVKLGKLNQKKSIYRNL